MALPFGYVISIAGRIITSYLLLTALICGIYLVQQFVPLLEISLRYAIGGWAFTKLMTFTLPRLIEYALPLAALCVTYFTLLEARERRELLVMAASGAGHAHLVVAVLLAGAAAAGTSLAVSGFVKPAANFAYRSTQNDALNRVLSKELPVGAFYAQADRVLYSRASDDPVLRTIRLFEFDGEQLRQVLVSDCAKMRVQDGMVVANSCDLEGYRFGDPTTGKEIAAGAAKGMEPCRICLDPDGKVTVTRLAAGESSFSFVMNDVFRSATRNRSNELSLGSLLASDGGGFLSVRNATVATVKMLSAIACFVAVMLALVAVAFTNWRTRIAALPLGCGAMMLVMVVVNSQAWLFDVAAGPTTLMVKLGGLTLACLTATVLAAKLVYPRLIAPALVKP